MEGPTLGVRFSWVSFLMEVSVKRELTVIAKVSDMFPSLKQLQPYHNKIDLARAKSEAPINKIII